jgi:hypothetical protein
MYYTNKRQQGTHPINTSATHILLHFTYTYYLAKWTASVV